LASKFLLAQNPLITTIFSADPSAHVWPSDTNRLWIYGSHDLPESVYSYGYTMWDYHVFSTTDMVNWTDHGRVLHLSQVKWAESRAWAIDAVYWKGLYYLVYCMQEKEVGLFQTGLAVSKRPEGPFEDIGYIKGTNNGQDPCLFVDDDQTPYLYWGRGGECFGAKLTDDLLSVVPNSIVDLTKQLYHVYEGPWVHKYKGKYYLSYPNLKDPNKDWTEIMHYATADHPLGPYTNNKVYIDKFKGQAGTNHGSITKFKGQWYAFYHSSWLSGGLSDSRCLMADYLYYNPDGSIKPLIPTKKGMGLAKKTTTTIWLEAENGEKTGGKLNWTKVDTTISNYSGTGYVNGFDKFNAYVSFLAQVALPAKFKLVVAYSSPEGDKTTEIMINSFTFRDFKLPKTSVFKEIEVGNVALKPGDNEVRIIKIDSGIAIDYIKLVQIIDN